MSFNKIILVGNLGREPELRYLPNGTAVCNFSVATTEKRKDKNGEMGDITTWFKVTLWDKRAETAAKFLTKGSTVYIEGKLRTEEWTDKDGKTRTSLEVFATEMQFLGGGNKSENSQVATASATASASSGKNPFANTVDGNSDTFADDSDIPF